MTHPAAAPTAPTSAAAWIAAARPRTLPAAAAPVVVGTACAHLAGGVAWGPALAALGGAACLQLTSNFANDVYDAEAGADGADRLGPTRAVAAGWISARAMRVAMVLAIAAATACGAYLTAVAGWPVVAIGLASIACAIAYTGGPWPLGYHGLGDVFVFVFFGLVAVMGTVLVQRGAEPALAMWWCAVPVGALATAILVVNNLRDRVGDARVGKRTLAVRLGRRATVAEYGALLAVAYLVPLGLALAWRAPTVALPVVTAPLALARLHALTRTDGAALNPLLGATAQLLLLFALTFAAGLVLAA
ncbi:MAG: 1,4-dihydroxy-2-naphthoate polyprenyltransferase [Kofleriaceae bacterium]|nr:1,4-dihydroxy-2-naphthoate polyprenyltransferase [Kofleriaceae bacterium]